MDVAETVALRPLVVVLRLLIDPIAEDFRTRILSLRSRSFCPTASDVSGNGKRGEAFAHPPSTHSNRSDLLNDFSKGGKLLLDGLKELVHLTNL